MPDVFLPCLNKDDDDDDDDLMQSQWRIQTLSGGAVLTYLPCRPFSLQSFLLFLPKIRWGGGAPLGPPLSLEFVEIATLCQQNITTRSVRYEQAQIKRIARALEEKLLV